MLENPSKETGKLMIGATLDLVLLENLSMNWVKLSIGAHLCRPAVKGVKGLHAELPFEFKFEKVKTFWEIRIIVRRFVVAYWFLTAQLTNSLTQDNLCVN